MATDWAADVKKYVAKADDAAIAGIVRYCGIALRNRDSALVSFSDKAETDRVRNNFLKKKLALTQPDSLLDAAIAKVGDAMKADRTKNRVTVYYLLASEFKQLGLFIKAPPAAKKAPAAKAAAPVKVAAKSGTTAKVAGTAAVVVGAAVVAAKAKPVATKKAAPAKVAAAPAKKAAAPAKATTAKAAAPASNATQGLLDKAASTASDAGKASTAAVAGTVAAAGALGAAALGAAAGAADTVKDGAAKAADTVASTASGLADKASGMLTGGTKPATSTAASTSADDGSEMNWLWWVIGLAVLAFLAWWWFSSRNPEATETNTAEAAASASASEVGTDLAAAKPEGSEAIPAGAGVTSEMRSGQPVVKVYFDSGMTAVTPDFAKTAGGLKSWLDTHAGTSLAVSGYSDPSGNAKANAELSKQRAQAVQSQLVAAGIPATSAALVKPEVSADTNVPKEAARRVEVVVKSD